MAATLTGIQNYLTFYEHYIKNAREYHTTTVMDKIFDVLGSLLPTAKHKFASLAIGCSDGLRDLQILKKICSTLPADLPVIYKAVEPNSLATNDFSNKVKEEFGNRVNFEAFPTTFEQFISEQTLEEKYDFISSVHSIYFMSAEKMLKDCYALLKPGGVLLCVAMGNTLENQTYNYLADLEDFLGQEMFAEIVNTQYNSTLLSGIAKKQGWEYNVEEYESDIDASVLFNNESTESNGLLDFLLHTMNFKLDLIDEKREIIKKKFLQICAKKDGKKWIETTNCMFLVYKK